MGNVYDRRRHHQLLHHKTTIFLPMFCRLSLKDINLSSRRRDSSLSDEPSSPKVSCMGQVKRSNRIIGLPAASADATTATHGHHKYSKLKKLFSSKTLFPPATSSLPTATLACATAAGGRSGNKSCRSSKEVCVDNLRRLKLKKDCEQAYVKVVDVGELDPPLPVLKRVAPPPGVGRDEVNIWKRRFDGAALKTLQIENVHLPNSNIKSQLPTV
ncbi:hypothetical protein C2S51_004077 [Perilla frutescens var. frutescens]|nr:hypothetical protein C2S51_004077 [Perilla frutescens var. frutescens]